MKQSTQHASQRAPRERLMRSQFASVADIGGELYLVGRDSVVRRLEGDSAQLARTVLAFLGTPHTTDEILEYVESLAGPLGEGRAVVEQLIDVLAQTGALTAAPDDRSRQRERAVVPANIVVAVTGAIAATHAPALVAALQRRGHIVEVALTESAQRFVAVDALAAIAGREIHTTLWPSTPHAPVPHVALASWADLVIVYPASATTIGRLAHGDFSDLVSAIALTTRAPVVLAPSMNDAMYAAPSVARNLAQLRDDGFVVLHGVPSLEIADAPGVRGTHAGVAPAPGEVAAMVDALRAADALVRPGSGEVPGVEHARVHSRDPDPGYVPVVEDALAQRRAEDPSSIGDAPARDRVLLRASSSLARPRLSLRVSSSLMRPRVPRRPGTPPGISRGAVAGANESPRGARPAVTASDWDAIYRAGTCGAPILPWVSATCDGDIAAALAAYAAPGDRLLDAGCGLGQVARHAAAQGHPVVATDLSETALHVARDAADPDGRTRDIVWLVDDICATRLCGPFDVIVDRATLHTLPASRVHAWAQSMRRLTVPGSILIVKAHRHGVTGVTTGWTASAIADRLPDFEVIDERAGELPGVHDGTPIPAILIALRRRNGRIHAEPVAKSMP